MLVVFGGEIWDLFREMFKSQIMYDYMGWVFRFERTEIICGNENVRVNLP